MSLLDTIKAKIPYTNRPNHDVELGEYGNISDDQRENSRLIHLEHFMESGLLDERITAENWVIGRVFAESIMVKAGEIGKDTTKARELFHTFSGLHPLSTEHSLLKKAGKGLQDIGAAPIASTFGFTYRDFIDSAFGYEPLFRKLNNIPFTGGLVGTISGKLFGPTKRLTIENLHSRKVTKPLQEIRDDQKTKEALLQQGRHKSYNPDEQFDGAEGLIIKKRESVMNFISLLVGYNPQHGGDMTSMIATISNFLQLVKYDQAKNTSLFHVTEEFLSPTGANNTPGLYAKIKNSELKYDQFLSTLQKLVDGAGTISLNQAISTPRRDSMHKQMFGAVMANPDVREFIAKFSNPGGVNDKVLGDDSLRKLLEINIPDLMRDMFTLLSTDRYLSTMYAGGNQNEEAERFEAVRKFREYGVVLSQHGAGRIAGVYKESTSLKHNVESNEPITISADTILVAPVTINRSFNTTVPLTVGTTVLPIGYNITSGTIFPAGFQLPMNFVLPSGTVFSAGTILKDRITSDPIIDLESTTVTPIEQLKMAIMDGGLDDILDSKNIDKSRVGVLLYLNQMLKPTDKDDELKKKGTDKMKSGAGKVSWGGVLATLFGGAAASVALSYPVGSIAGSIAGVSTQPTERFELNIPATNPDGTYIAQTTIEADMNSVGVKPDGKIAGDGPKIKEIAGKRWTTVDIARIDAKEAVKLETGLKATYGNTTFLRDTGTKVNKTQVMEESKKTSSDWWHNATLTVGGVLTTLTAFFTGKRK
jgi:hypothetical protein